MKILKVYLFYRNFKPYAFGEMKEEIFKKTFGIYKYKMNENNEVLVEVPIDVYFYYKKNK